MNFENFKWLNQSRHKIEGDKITIDAPAITDYFNSPVPEGGKFKPPMGNAPFFYTDIEGDFVARVKVKPNFKSTFDACCLMVIQNENIWIKAAYEMSDFNTTAVVSVVTNTLSDDANGCNIASDSLWLQVARVGNNYAIHYSLDGQKYDMVRVFYLDTAATVKVGIEAQCPTGDGGMREFSEFSIEKRTINNLRAGV
ncbi:MAG: DUF1349 domain-containing protein [Defluviitaleaceae bacterium]|nr:DUF1349 domain-containing protein [Defluviitaleaceae bacterium]